MTNEDHADLFELEQGSDIPPPISRADEPILAELVKVLAAHPGGLRRWSVMRAIRKERENASREIPQKFEDEVERTFRRFCAEAETKAGARPVSDAFFFRPKEKAGEVWSIIPERAKAWLDGQAFRGAARS